MADDRQGYLERSDRIRIATRPVPRFIVACGAVPKDSSPGKLLVTNYRPTIVYVDPWPVQS